MTSPIDLPRLAARAAARALVASDTRTVVATQEAYARARATACAFLAAGDGVGLAFDDPRREDGSQPSHPSARPRPGEHSMLSANGPGAAAAQRTVWAPEP